MNNFNADQNVNPAPEPGGRTAIECEFRAIVARAIAHPDTVQVISITKTAGDASEISPAV